MVMLSNTPKTSKETKSAGRPRTPLPVQKCDIGDCPFTCKYGKHMKTHKAEAHGVTPDDSVLEASVSVSVSELYVTKEPEPDTESQEEAKVHNSINGHPHSTLKIDLSCPLGYEEQEGKEEKGEKRKRGNKGESDDDNDEEEKVTTKKERVENSVEIIDDEPKSPDTLRRQRVMEEAKLTIEGEKQKAIEIQQQRIMAMLDSGDSEKLGTDDSTLQEVSGVEAGESQSMLEETENPDNDNTIVMSGDSLSQTLSQDKSVEVIPAEQSTQPAANEILEEIQAELDSKTRSHEDAISEKNTLETMLAQEISHRKYIEMKLAQSKAELKANKDVVVNLQAALKNPAPPTNTEYSAEVQNKLKQL